MFDGESRRGIKIVTQDEIERLLIEGENDPKYIESRRFLQEESAWNLEVDAVIYPLRDAINTKKDRARLEEVRQLLARYQEEDAENNHV